MIQTYMKKIEGYTKTNPKRQESLYNQIKCLSEDDIPGDFVECGVWRGGLCMLAAYTYMDIKDIRDIHLFDTFKGMTKPCNFDRKFHDHNLAIKKWEDAQAGNYNSWCFSSLRDVTKNMKSTKYPEDKVHFYEGCATKTTEGFNKKISLLRLDVDFYEATKESINNLYPLLSDGGFLVIDDYGVWEGANKAIKEFFKDNNLDINDLIEVDHSCVYYRKGES